MFNVEAEGRQKVEDCRQKHFVNEEKNISLGGFGSWTLSLAFIGLVFIVRETLGAISVVFWASLSIAQTKLFRHSWVPGLY